MNKRIFLIIALVIILTLLGVWAYILVYGTPEVVEERFARFSSEQPETSLPNGTETVVPEPNGHDSFDEEDVDQSDDEYVPPPLQQITTEPVAGQQFVFKDIKATATSTADTLFVYYVELGTGHIYRYDPFNSQKDRISNHTIQQTRQAFITPDATYAVLIRGYTGNQQITIIDLQENTDDRILLQETRDIENIFMTNAGDLLYTRRTDGGSVGYQYFIETDFEQELFRFPLRNITVAWAPEASGEHYVYQAPSTQLLSTVYRVIGNSITRTNITGYDMSVINNGSSLAYSYQTEPDDPQTIISEALYLGELFPLSTAIRKNKCDFTSGEDIICGYELSENIHTQESWLRGIVKNNDSLWYVDITNESSRLLTSPERNVGRQVDLNNILIDNITGSVLFQNRRDGTLWLFL